MGSTPQAPQPTPTREELVKKFQILDSVSGVLAMILDGADATSVSSSVAKLHGRFAECEEFLKKLPGGDMSKDEQKKKIAQLTESITKKKALVAKYKDLEVLRNMAGAGQAAPPAADAQLAPPSSGSAPPSAGLEQAANDGVFSGQMTPRSSTAGLLGDDMFFGALDGDQK